MEFRVGDTIEVSSNQVGQPTRRGVVEEILSSQPTELRIRWDDGHESNLFPAGGMVHIIESAGG